MKVETIQTLHPQGGKTNKKIYKEKYEFIRKHLFSILSDKEPTHNQQMEELFDRVKDNFEGGVQWYRETVKLDLEARGMILRTNSNPEMYKLTDKND